jgi:hypothetical protein
VYGFLGEPLPDEAGLRMLALAFQAARDKSAHLPVILRRLQRCVWRPAPGATPFAPRTLAPKLAGNAAPIFAHILKTFPPETLGPCVVGALSVPGSVRVLRAVLGGETLPRPTLEAIEKAALEESARPGSKRKREHEETLVRCVRARLADTQ